MRKLTMLVAGTAGYVLGTRAGRERYEQIKSAVRKLRNNPTVQKKAREAGTAVKENAPLVKDKVADAASSAKAAAHDKLHRSSNGVEHTPSSNIGSATPYPQG